MPPTNHPTSSINPPQLSEPVPEIVAAVPAPSAAIVQRFGATLPYDLGMSSFEKLSLFNYPLHEEQTIAKGRAELCAALFIQNNYK